MNKTPDDGRFSLGVIRLNVSTGRELNVVSRAALRGARGRGGSVGGQPRCQGERGSQDGRAAEEGFPEYIQCLNILFNIHRILAMTYEIRFFRASNIR